jgi:hypothetical protein
LPLQFFVSHQNATEYVWRLLGPTRKRIWLRILRCNCYSLTLLRHYTLTVRRFIWCWRPRGQVVSVSFHATVG